MKKITLALVAVMLVLGMTQCKKEQPTPTPEPTPDGEVVYISMKVDDGGKHIVYPGTGAYVFENNDKIYVGNDGRYVGTLTYTDGAFSGSITSPHTNDYLHFYFTGGKAPATDPTAGSTASFTVDISDQTSKLPVLSYGHSTIKYVNGTTAYTCLLENKCGLVEFKITTSNEEISSAITVGGMKTTATIDFENPGITPTDDIGGITLYSVSSKEKWAILLPQEMVLYPSLSVEGWDMEGIPYKAGIIPAVTENFYYGPNCDEWGNDMWVWIVSPNSDMYTFTVNSNGDKVWFSQGNLQYIGSAATPYWKFAENQWDYFGETTGQCSTSQTVDRDLFGWGTSGWGGGTYWQPYDVGWVDDASCNYGYGRTSYGGNLTGYNRNEDWGVYNAISNGGNTAGKWRTLTIDEWYYLFNQRGTKCYEFAIVNGVCGVILFSDSNVRPTGGPGEHFSDHVYSESEWRSKEALGYVFLPVTGYRTPAYYSSPNTVTEYVSGEVIYWSSTHRSDLDGVAESLYIDGDDNHPFLCSKADNNGSHNYGLCHYGCAVRLVRDVQ